MSTTRAAVVRPFNGLLQCQCPLHPRSPAPFSTRLAAPLTGAKLSYNGGLQRRHQSSASGQHAQEEKPPTSSSKLLLRALRQSFSLRPLVGALRGQTLRSLYRQSPEELVIAIALLCGIGCACVYAVYAYFNYFQSEQFTRFPPEIAKSLRRALYYSNYSPDPQSALKYYKLALEQCSEVGLDPFSDEVMGIKIQLAAWLEKIGSFQNSIGVLEALLRDSKKWVQVMEKSVQDGLVDKSGKLVGDSVPQDQSAKQDEESETHPEPENLWAKRTRILGKSVGISVKLGELYADEHVLQSDLAGERLIWAVETVLKELQRRQVDGVKEGEGDWMTPEQIGGALEALGNHYESKSQHYLAAPLYLQAVTLSPRNSCHTAVLMNNLAISLAQQPVRSPLEALQPSAVNTPSNDGASKSPTRSTLLASSRSWASQALATAQKVTGEDRTDECDEACAVALCNLGDIAAMTGDIEEAKRRFKESLTLSKKIAFHPGTKQAQEGLKRVSITSSK
ncbi:TPR domain-containing protein [Biscogniauxia marginata]|nr:TPR domain-containing protein [Biscogniauxia marginata]